MNQLHDIWVAIGAPSWVSGVLLPGAIGFLAKYTKSKISEIGKAVDELALLKQEVQALDRLLNVRINDIKKTPP